MSRHTFKRDDVVTIFNMNGRGFIIEGRATVLRPIPNVDEQYWVRFHGRDGKPKQGEEYERFVDPQGQADPSAHVAHLNAATTS